MGNILPCNGRIAIIDDKIGEVEPLMKVFAKNQLPYTFYEGNNQKYFPEKPQNDIRLLFLDLNLVTDSPLDDKNVKSVLYSTLTKVISIDNYPYLLISWSKQEKEYMKVLKELFDKELKEIAPIDIVPFVKSDFFSITGEPKEKDEKDIIEELEKVLSANSAYSNILNWENIVHKSADTTLQEVFGNYTSKDWHDRADYIITTLGQAYLGKHYNDVAPQEKLQGSYKAFNSVFIDTLEAKINNVSNLKYLSDDPKQQPRNKNINVDLNTRLNLSFDPCYICEPGVVFIYNIANSNTFFDNMIKSVIPFYRVKLEIQKEFPESLNCEINKKSNKKHNDIVQKVKKTWIKIGVVVTPLCDYAQKKNVEDRVVRGLMIEAEYEDFFDNRTEAIFISPKINYLDKAYILVLDYRHFTTLDLNNLQSNIEGEESQLNVQLLFRIRQQLLSEVQSKLARHINRQGVLFLP